MDTELDRGDAYARRAAAVRGRFQASLLATMAFVVVLGGLYFAGPWLGDVRPFALVPGAWSGLVGVLTAPLLHGSA